MDCYTVLVLRALEVRVFKVGKNLYGQFCPLEWKKLKQEQFLVANNLT